MGFALISVHHDGDGDDDDEKKKKTLFALFSLFSENAQRSTVTPSPPNHSLHCTKFVKRTKIKFSEKTSGSTRLLYS